MATNDLEAAFASAYKQKFIELLKQNCSSLSPSDKMDVCSSVCSNTPTMNMPNRPNMPPIPPTAPGVTPKPIASKGSGFLQKLIIVILIVAIIYVAYKIYQEISKGKRGNIMGSSLIASIDDSVVGKGTPEEKPKGIPKSGKHLYMFHSPGCPHCVQIMPGFKS